MVHNAKMAAEAEEVPEVPGFDDEDDNADDNDCANAVILTDLECGSVFSAYFPVLTNTGEGQTSSAALCTQHTSLLPAQHLTNHITSHSSSAPVSASVTSFDFPCGNISHLLP